MAYQSEIEKLERRYQENPDQWFAALADQYRKTGSMDLALQVVRAGLEKRPNYVSGHIVLGRCLLDQKNDAEASAVFKRVLELDAENIMALKTLAEIADRTGDVDGSRSWLGRLLEIDPMNDEAREALAKLPAAGDAPAAPAGSAAPPPPPPAGAVEGFEATSFADVAPQEEPAAEVVPVAAAPMPALEIERSGVSEAAPAAMPALDLEPTTTDLDVVPANAEMMPALEREDLSMSLEDGPAAAGAPAMLPLDDSALVGGADAALGLTPEPVLEPLESIELEAPMELTSAQAEPEPLVTASTQDETAALPSASEPEPVVTETMAEVYAKQGLLEQARAVYQQLLAQRPNDPKLLRRLAELSPASEPAARRRRPTAAVTGGISARAFVASVLTGRGAPAMAPPREPAAPSALETAFAAEPASGAPTGPAADEASLASVFPEDAGQPAQRGGGTGGGGAFSFDEFFGGRRPARPSTPRANPTGAPGGEDDFRSWLKGLKT